MLTVPMQVDVLWRDRACQWSSLAQVHARYSGATQLQGMMHTCNLLQQGGAGAEADRLRAAVQAGAPLLGQTHRM
jgi:hypothetical protein